MTLGRIVVDAVCVSTRGVRVAKTPQLEAFAGEHGFAGDRHATEFVRVQGRAEPNLRQWSAVSTDDVALICADLGVPVLPPGSLGENLRLDGLHLGKVAPRSVLAFPSGARLLATEQNDPCVVAARSLAKAYGPQVGRSFVRRAWGRRGILGTVLSTGLIRPGDAVTLLAPNEAVVTW